MSIFLAHFYFIVFAKNWMGSFINVNETDTSLWQYKKCMITYNKE